MSGNLNIVIKPSDIDFDDIEIDRDDYKFKHKVDTKVRKKVVDKIFQSKLKGTLSSISKTDGTSWEHNEKYRTSHPKSRYPNYQYAIVDPVELASFHNQIGHNVDDAVDTRVDEMVEEINSENVGLPTPPVSYKLNYEYKGCYPHQEEVDKLVYKPIKEGRHRTVASVEAGLKQIPILVSAGRIRR